MKDTVAVVLAAGKGVRMRSRRPKVLHTILGRPMLSYVLETLSKLACSRTLVVVGHQADAVRRAVGADWITWVEQHEQLGTGHALLQTRQVVGDDSCTLLVVPGDVPLVRAATLRSLLAAHQEDSAAATFLTALLANPTGYGRVIRDQDGTPLKIVEEGDADALAKALREVNAGIYAFSSPAVFEVLRLLQPGNVQREYYLTDSIELFREMGLPTKTVAAEDADEVRGINSVEELRAVEAIVKQRIVASREGEMRINMPT